MRLRRITLTNYRGVESAEVRFGDGVTIVSGPNEVGKSTIAEALRLLKRYKASSKHQDIKAIQSVGRDAAPEAEVELETGPYQLTFRKRWLSRPATELAVTSPRPEQSNGDDAHDRFLAILQETVDVDLLLALESEQGASLEQAKLGDIAALQRSLADSSEHVDGHDELRARVDTEYQRYFTATGRPSGEFAAAAARLETATKAERETAVAVEEADRYVAEYERVTTLLAAAREQLAAAQDSRVAAQRDAEALVTLEQAVASAAESLAIAETAAATAQARVAERAARREATEERAREAQEASTRLEASHDEYGAVTATRAAARRAVLDAEVEQEQRRAVLKQLRGELEHHRLAAEYEALRQRRDAARDAEAQRVTMQGRLSAVAGVGHADISKLETLEGEQRIAAARREAAAARVVVRALGEGVTVDGEHLPAGEERATHALDDVEVVVPDIVEVRVTPGLAPDELERAVRTATAAFRAALDALGIAELDEARALAQQRAELQAQLGEAQRAVAAALAGQTLDALTAEVAEREARLTERLVGDEVRSDAGVDTGSAADTTAVLEARVREAEAADEEAQTLARECRAADDALLDRERNAGEQLARAEEAAERSDREQRAAVAELERDREAADDEAVTVAAAAAAERVEQAHHAAVRAKEALAAADPETVAMCLTNADGLVERWSRDVAAQGEARARLEGLIDDRAKDGLYDRHLRAQAELEAATAQHLRVARAAEASRLLRDTLERHRAAAQLAYVAPFTTRIEALGRPLFGSTFRVGVRPDLQIENRTLHGTTVPFESLSAGAREQLVVLSRLAAAQLVDPAEGAPVIFDDTLGYADPGRLAALGAVLNQAGDSAQIIILTCQEARFAGIGGAEVVRLEPSHPE